MSYQWWWRELEAPPDVMVFVCDRRFEMNRWVTCMVVGALTTVLGCQGDAPQGGDESAAAVTAADGQQVVLKLPNMT